MSDLFLVATPLMFHVGFFLSVEMVSGCDRHGRGYAITALRTREHAIGLMAAFVAAGFLVFGNTTNALAISSVCGGLMLLDIFMLFRAFKAAKCLRKDNG